MIVAAIALGVFAAGALFGALVVNETRLRKRAVAALDFVPAAARGELVDWEDPRHRSDTMRP